MSSLTTIVQYSAGTFRWCNKVRKGNKRSTDGNEEIKLSLFGDYMIEYVENAKEFTKTTSTNEMLRYKSNKTCIGLKL